MGRTNNMQTNRSPESGLSLRAPSVPSTPAANRKRLQHDSAYQYTRKLT
jgi:hypothetical protein